MASPFPLGMNSSAAGASDTEFFMRDLSRHGRYVVLGGAANGQDLDPSFIDFDSYFPISLPSGASSVVLVITDGAWIGPMGTYAWTIDSRFTLTSNAVKNADNVPDPDLVFTGAGGSGQVAIGGIPRRSGWSVKIEGPFASLTAGQRGFKILPLNDANPERLYSDALRASLVATGTRQWRVMEDLRVNYADVVPYLTDKGPKTGLPSATIEAIVQLCNDLNIGLTFDFHGASPQPYIDRISAYVAANLKNGLPLYPAWGNEGDWNEAFPHSNYERHQAWLLGYAASGGTRPSCVGWTSTGFTPAAFAGGWNSPFEQDYRPSGTGPFMARTTQALNAGDYILGGIYGFGRGIWRVTSNTASGAIFPYAGNSAFVLIADEAALLTAKRRFYANRTWAIYQTVQSAWTAAGHSPANCRPVINVQSGPTLGVEKEILDANNFALWSVPGGPSVQQAPYFYTYNGDDVGAGPLGTFLDNIFVTDKADIEAKQYWVRDRRAAIKAAAPAGVTLPDNCHEIYEWFHHNVFRGTNGPAFFKAYRRDARLGMLLKYGLTLHARSNPGSLLTVFNIATGEPDDATSGWGVYFYADEARSSTPSNPAGIALAEWSASAASGIPSGDVLYKTTPAAGTATVTAIFGPNISTGFTGVVRATGSRTFDLPFTKAAGAATADMTYTAIAGETLAFTIVPQPGVFTVGKLSGGSGAVDPPPVDPPPVDPPVDPPLAMPNIDHGGAILHQYRDLLGCAPVVCMIAVGIGVARAIV